MVQDGSNFLISEMYDNCFVFREFEAITISPQVDSAFYPPWNGKMSTSHRAVMLCGWDGNRRPGGT